jgi:hypothetical protein
MLTLRIVFLFQISFEKVPKEEKGFDFSHDAFELEAKSQATLEIRLAESL